MRPIEALRSISTGTCFKDTEDDQKRIALVETSLLASTQHLCDTEARKPQPFLAHRDNPLRRNEDGLGVGE
jgi:hypothetical protein